jgi:cobalt-zinc-cadmium efflux system protein
MMIVAAAGLIVNLFVALWLKEERAENINVRSAFWHAAGDALASVGVIVGGVIITLSGLNIADPIIGAIIGLIIVVGAVGIFRDGVRVLLEAVPTHVIVDSLVNEILAIPGVLDIHDVHVWSITPEIHAMSGHVLIADQAVSDAASIQQNVENLLHNKFRILHSTLQFECQNCESNGVICSLKSGSEPCPKHKTEK